MASCRLSGSRFFRANADVLHAEVTQQVLTQVERIGVSVASSKAVRLHQQDVMESLDALKRPVRIALVGELGSGKTTALLNAIGEDPCDPIPLFPVGAGPVSKTSEMILVRYGPELSLRLCFRNDGGKDVREEIANGADLLELEQAPWNSGGVSKRERLSYIMQHLRIPTDDEDSFSSSSDNDTGSVHETESCGLLLPCEWHELESVEVTHPGVLPGLEFVDMPGRGHALTAVQLDIQRREMNEVDAIMICGKGTASVEHLRDIANMGGFKILGRQTPPVLIASYHSTATEPVALEEELDQSFQATLEHIGQFAEQSATWLDGSLMIRRAFFKHLRQNLVPCPRPIALMGAERLTFFGTVRARVMQQVLLWISVDLNAFLCSARLIIRLNQNPDQSTAVVHNLLHTSHNKVQPGGGDANVEQMRDMCAKRLAAPFENSLKVLAESFMVALRVNHPEEPGKPPSERRLLDCMGSMEHIFELHASQVLVEGKAVFYGCMRAIAILLAERTMSSSSFSTAFRMKSALRFVKNFLREMGDVDDGDQPDSALVAAVSSEATLWWENKEKAWWAHFFRMDQVALRRSAWKQIVFRSAILAADDDLEPIAAVVRDAAKPFLEERFHHMQKWLGDIFDASLVFVAEAEESHMDTVPDGGGEHDINDLLSSWKTTLSRWEAHFLASQKNEPTGAKSTRSPLFNLVDTQVALTALKEAAVLRARKTIATSSAKCIAESVVMEAAGDAPLQVPAIHAVWQGDTSSSSFAFSMSRSSRSVIDAYRSRRFELCKKPQWIWSNESKSFSVSDVLLEPIVIVLGWRYAAELDTLPLSWGCAEEAPNAHLIFLVVQATQVEALQARLVQLQTKERIVLVVMQGSTPSSTSKCLEASKLLMECLDLPFYWRFPQHIISCEEADSHQLCVRKCTIPRMMSYCQEPFSRLKDHIIERVKGITTTCKHEPEDSEYYVMCSRLQHVDYDGDLSVISELARSLGGQGGALIAGLLDELLRFAQIKIGHELQQLACGSKSCTASVKDDNPGVTLNQTEALRCFSFLSPIRPDEQQQRWSNLLDFNDLMIQAQCLFGNLIQESGLTLSMLQIRYCLHPRIAQLHLLDQKSFSVMSTSEPTRLPLELRNEPSVILAIGQGGSRTNECLSALLGGDLEFPCYIVFNAEFEALEIDCKLLLFCPSQQSECDREHWVTEFFSDARDASLRAKLRVAVSGVHSAVVRAVRSLARVTNSHEVAEVKMSTLLQHAVENFGFLDGVRFEATMMMDDILGQVVVLPEHPGVLFTIVKKESDANGDTDTISVDARNGCFWSQRVIVTE